MSVSTTVPQVVVSVSPGEMAANYQGKYAAGVPYQVGQWVAEGELLWACVVPTVGRAPAEGSAFWRVVGAIG